MAEGRFERWRRRREPGAPVTPRLERYVRARFPEHEVDVVLRALAEWRIPYEDEPPGERLQAAVLVVSDGRAEDLQVGFGIARQDWRDLLVSAGMEHGNWGDVFNAELRAAEGESPR